jgi:type II secretory pathway pseudopilin PulG
MLATPSSRSLSRRGRGCDSGFTRIEAVILVAITALMIALGVSALRTYQVRAEIVESVELAKFAQHQVTQAFRNTGTPPADGADAGLSNDDLGSAGPYVGETRVVDGRIDLVFGAEADKAIEGQTLSLTPFETADQEVVWVCGNKAPGVGLKPLGFAAGGPLALQTPTTIEPRFLPPTCR